MLKKVFKKVKKVVKKVTKFVKKYWKEIILVAAVVFTAGAALGYVGMGAGGGLAFGAGAGVGGMTGVTTAFSALGNTVMGAMGMQGSFGGTMTAKSAAVQGLGTGGMATSSAGMSANVIGGNVATQTANAGYMSAAGATPTAGAATLPGVGIPQAAAAAPQMSGVGAASMSSAVAPPALPGAITPLAEGAASTGLTMGETMQLGSVAAKGYDAYAQGEAADEAEQEAEDRQAARWDWNYGDAGDSAGDPVPMSEIGYQPSQGLLQRQQEQLPSAATPPPSQYQYSQPSTLDDVAAARYA
jgi:hypothetical protein